MVAPVAGDRVSLVQSTEFEKCKIKEDFLNLLISGWKWMNKYEFAPAPAPTPRCQPKFRTYVVLVCSYLYVCMRDMVLVECNIDCNIAPWSFSSHSGKYSPQNKQPTNQPATSNLSLCPPNGSTSCQSFHDFVRSLFSPLSQQYSIFFSDSANRK